MAGWRGELNAKLRTLPVTHNTGADPEPVDRPRTFGNQARRSRLSNGAASCSPWQQETGRHRTEETNSLYLIRFGVLSPCL